MKAAKLIESRQSAWQRLDNLCEEFGKRSKNKVPPEKAREFANLYRQACADLALAESNQLPPTTIDYLHQLVARAHNQLYRSKKFDRQGWYERIFVDTPKRIFNDTHVHIATLIFWGLFLISTWLAYDDTIWPGFAEQVAGAQRLEQSEEMFNQFGDRSVTTNSLMTGFYVYNNAGIGLVCFVTMLFVPVGMVTLSFNAMFLGTVFGYMFRPETAAAGMNFKNFVTAHGPFEWTAIILSAGAGLKIGLSWLATGGLSRKDWAFTERLIDQERPRGAADRDVFGFAVLHGGGDRRFRVADDGSFFAMVGERIGGDGLFVDFDDLLDRVGVSSS